MDEKDINRTHVVALKTEHGLLRSIEIPIGRPEQFIHELSAMIDNSNRSVWDMQSFFTTRYPKTDDRMDYIHPNLYQSTFVDCARYPELYDYSELRSSWEKSGKSARESYNNECAQKGTAPDATIAAQKESEAIESLKKRQKSGFYGKAIRWINASCYNDTSSQLNRDDSIKMFSKENIGWNHFCHQVTDDVKVTLKTNFGYGSAAHFLLAVQYKGVDILPYSYIVNYYTANMAEIVRCTRNYRLCRESWHASFDFISDFVNNSVSDPQNFVESYIMREVIEMMQGLEEIVSNPNGFMERIGNNKPESCIIYVHPMSYKEKARMACYPDETAILFKVEKITGALYFLNNLTAIAKEVKTVQPHIDRLLEIGTMLYPEVQDAIVKINKKIQEQTAIKSKLGAKFAALSAELSQFEEEITRLRDEATQDNPFNMSDYEKSHPEYVSKKSEKEMVVIQSYRVRNLIRDLNSFVEFLNGSLTKLENVKQLKVAC